MIEMVVRGFNKALDTEIDRLSKKVHDGTCSSMEEYRNDTGMIKGLEKAKTILSDTIKKHINEGDEEDF